MSKILIGPAYGHVFGSDSVEAQVTSIRGRCKVQRTTIRFDPLTVLADGVIPGSRAAAEGCDDDDQEEQARHSNLTPDTLGSSRGAGYSNLHSANDDASIENIKRR